MSYLTDIVNVLENNMEFVLIGVAVAALILLILLIITITNLVQIKKLKKKYEKFMNGSDAQTLEDTIANHLNEIDGLIASNAKNEKNISQPVRTGNTHKSAIIKTINILFSFFMKSPLTVSQIIVAPNSFG